MKRKRTKQKRPSSKKAIVDDQSLLYAASCAHREGRLDDALKGYLLVVKRNPQWGQVLNALGTVYLDLDQRDRAKDCFEKAAATEPTNLSACYNLARLKQQEGDHEGALVLYQNIVEEKPDFGQAWNNLGLIHREIGNQKKSLACFEKAVDYEPAMAEAWNNLGVLQDELQLYDDAALSYKKALNLRPDYASAHFNLGCVLQKGGQFGEAEKHYRQALEINPQDEAAEFMLHSLGITSVLPEAAPAEHVRRIFDQCAGNFEKILVKDLEYRTPELLFDHVFPYLKREMKILDLGCGTGLGARLYRPYATKLTGVDVSTRMLEQAALKKIYDHLEAVDILREWPFTETFDLVYSSDVFVYFGNLSGIIEKIAAVLSSRGIAAFSVELLEEGAAGYQLNPSGRYSHTLHYIKKCLDRNGFTLLKADPSDLRKQSGKPVRGLLIVAEKDN